MRRLATLEDVLKSVRTLPDFIDLEEIPSMNCAGTKTKQYMAYFAQSNKGTVRMENFSVYVNGDDARVIVPCFMCASAASGGFKDVVQSAIDAMVKDPGVDKVRRVYVDEAERYAIVEKISYDAVSGLSTSASFRIYELPDKSLRVAGA